MEGGRGGLYMRRRFEGGGEGRIEVDPQSSGLGGWVFKGWVIWMGGKSSFYTSLCCGTLYLLLLYILFCINV